ncbi:putative cytosol aminopeptidase OS=Lysinibacillus sphaericus OX=1421 GN=pepA PE=3 SV=1 [Lysinibacillus sphaericus]
MKKHAHLKRILFVGLDERKNLTEGDLRAAFGLVGKELNALKVKEYSIWLESFTTETITVDDVAFLAGEGTTLGYYTIPHYKTTSNEVDKRMEAVHFVTTAEDLDNVVASFEVGIIYADAVNEARSLINLPPNLLTATDLANYAQSLAMDYDFEVEILDKAQHLLFTGILRQSIAKRLQGYEVNNMILCNSLGYDDNVRKVLVERIMDLI